MISEISVSENIKELKKVKMTQLKIKPKNTKAARIIYGLLIDLYYDLDKTNYDEEWVNHYRDFFNILNQHVSDFTFFDHFRVCLCDDMRLKKIGRIVSYYLSKLHYVREADWCFYIDESEMYFSIPGELLEYDYDEYESKYMLDEDLYWREDEWYEKYKKNSKTWQKLFSELKRQNYMKHDLYKYFDLSEFLNK